MSEMATSQVHNRADDIARIQEILNQDIERVNDLEALLATAKQRVERRKQELTEHQTAANHISVISPNQWNILSWAKSTRSYLKLCVERSRASRLNIELNFTIFKTVRRRLIDKLQSEFFHFPSASQSEVDNTFLEDWLNNQDYYDLERQPIFKGCSPEYAIRILGVLTVPEVMRRWESLTIWFPYNQLAGDIWEAIASRASGLSRLHIVGFSWEDLHKGYGDGDGEPSLWATPRVEDLKVKTMVGWERFLSFDPSSIQRLAVELAFEEEFFSQLARFSQLRTLTLSSPGIIEDIDVDANATNRISIPRLEELVLIGEFDCLDTVKFDLPNLKRVRMESHGPVFKQPAIPIIQPLEVHWAADSNIFFRDKILETADGDIRGFFLSYKSSDRFSVASFLKGNMLKVVKELSTEGVLPPRWRTVSFHDTYGGIETMQIHNIVGSDQDVDMLTCS